MIRTIAAAKKPISKVDCSCKYLDSELLVRSGSSPLQKILSSLFQLRLHYSLL